MNLLNFIYCNILVIKHFILKISFLTNHKIKLITDLTFQLLMGPLASRVKVDALSPESDELVSPKVSEITLIQNIIFTSQQNIKYFLRFTNFENYFKVVFYKYLLTYFDLKNVITFITFLHIYFNLF